LNHTRVRNRTFFMATNWDSFIKCPCYWQLVYCAPQVLAANRRMASRKLSSIKR